MEVLMVVAVISILVAIIIPAIGGAQTSAKRAKTRVQFSQWSAAIEQFRQEYGYYPAFGNAGGDAGSAFDDGRINLPARSVRFVQTLSGRKLDGSALTADSGGFAAGNIKGIPFCAFSADSLSPSNDLLDAFGNTEIVVLLDRNLDGVIDVEAGPDFPATAPLTVPSETTGDPVAVDLPEVGYIRAGVAFYSAGDGQRSVTSW